MRFLDLFQSSAVYQILLPILFKNSMTSLTVGFPRNIASIGSYYIYTQGNLFLNFLVSWANERRQMNFPQIILWAQLFYQSDCVKAYC